MDESSLAQNRRASRSPVMLRAQIEVGEQSETVILRNLSAGGALIEGKWLPAVGSVIVFVRNELRVQARIAWVQRNLAGVAFECPLDRAELLRQVPKPRERFEAQFRRPGLA